MPSIHALVHITHPSPVLRLPPHEQAARRERATRPIGSAPIRLHHLAPPAPRPGRKSIPYPNPPHRPLWMDCELTV